MRRLLLSAAAILIVALVSFTRFASFSTFTVTGTVKDESGKPLPGISVTEKGKRNSSLSNSDGTYSIVVSDSKAILEFSGVGYDPLQEKIRGNKVVDVIMKAAHTAMEEVVVTGYANDSQITMSRKSLQGRAAGLNVRGITGSPMQAPVQYYEKDEEMNTEDYDGISENNFHKVADDPLSTFSIDVDAASYSNVRRFLNEGQLPPAGAVRIEEMINYFSYNYPQPVGDAPFSINTELSDCPWNNQHKLVMIGLQGKKIPVENLPASNLVFLIDVSGSMQDANKLPLVKSSMKLLVDQLREEDRISLVVYAGNAGLVLPATSGAQKTKIREAIDQLEAGGSTAGGAGIKLAYKIARENFQKEGNNRVILCTDGDFNVGASSDDDMERLIEKERESGVYLTVLGYGMGNYKDNKMQKLADKGNGNHAYIDGMSEAKKVLVNEFGGTLFTIAKDVKLQLEFNPEQVQGYRLIGYENRMLSKEDFNDDKKDAGELGSGHTVTALYEIIPTGIKDTFLKSVDPLKYQKNEKPMAVHNGEVLTVKFRYKAPGGTTSKLLEHAVAAATVPFSKASENFRFATSVAEFGMLLRNSPFKSKATFNHVYTTAKNAKGSDAEGYRKEFVNLVRKASGLKGMVEEDDEDVSLNN
ncbi:MAG TPA: von Willebrand factor type A domain-containing protein [Flavisolibacter sp.]|nr:von Willebrand factor type A domain-containing protein [Flavisolibacter sp.]